MAMTAPLDIRGTDVDERPEPAESILDELTADLFNLDINVEPATDMAGYEATENCTNNGCTGSCASCGCTGRACKNC